MTLLPTPLEEAAKKLDPDAFAVDEFGSYALVSGSSRRASARTHATAAITAYLAQAEKEGWVMVPTNATAQMIAAAFPSTDRDVLSSEDLKTGAAAIMILEGPADLGAITGPAVKEAAAMCKDYRTMLAAAQNGGDIPAPPMGK
jgi:hypothetical protein